MKRLIDLLTVSVPLLSVILLCCSARVPSEVPPHGVSAPEESSETAALAASDNDGFDRGKCRCNGIELWGRVKVVTSHEDFRVQEVSSFADLRVKKVTGFADDCGRWQFVDSHEDFTIRYVTSHPDFRITFVDSFEGIP